MYKFDLNRTTGLLTATIDTLLSAEQAAAFAEELFANYETLRRLRKPRILIDTSVAPVQQSAAYAAMSHLKDRMPVVLPTAVVVSSALAKLQAGRDATTGVVRIFMSIADATAWLEAFYEQAADGTAIAAEPSGARIS